MKPTYRWTKTPLGGGGHFLFVVETWLDGLWTHPAAYADETAARAEIQRRVVDDAKVRDSFVYFDSSGQEMPDQDQ
jgi:hypothetical protein